MLNLKEKKNESSNDVPSAGTGSCTDRAILLPAVFFPDTDDPGLRGYVFLHDPSPAEKAERGGKVEGIPEKGDKIVTVGGIYGTISEVKDTFLIVEIDANVRIRVDKSSVVKDITDVQNR